MKECLVWTNTDGELCITQPAYDDRMRPQGETDDVLIARVAAKAIPAGTTYARIPASDVPTERIFRGAWVWDGGIKMDLVKAAILHALMEDAPDWDTALTLPGQPVTR